MKISANYGAIYQGGAEFRADRRMLQELSCLIPEIVISLGSGVEEVIEVILIGPSTDFGKPKNVEVKIVLRDGDQKYEDWFRVEPVDLNPRATREQRERNIHRLLWTALLNALHGHSETLGQRHEACERLARRLRGESESARATTN